MQTFLKVLGRTIKCNMSDTRLPRTVSYDPELFVLFGATTWMTKGVDMTVILLYAGCMTG